MRTKKLLLLKPTISMLQKTHLIRDHTRPTIETGTGDEGTHILAIPLEETQELLSDLQLLKKPLHFWQRQQCFGYSPAAMIPCLLQRCQLCSFMPPVAPLFTPFWTEHCHMWMNQRERGCCPSNLLERCCLSWSLQVLAWEIQIPLYNTYLPHCQPSLQSRHCLS